MKFALLFLSLSAFNSGMAAYRFATDDPTLAACGVGLALFMFGAFLMQLTYGEPTPPKP